MSVNRYRQSTSGLFRDRNIDGEEKEAFTMMVDRWKK